MKKLMIFLSFVALTFNTASACPEVKNADEYEGKKFQDFIESLDYYSPLSYSVNQAIENCAVKNHKTITLSTLRILTGKLYDSVMEFDQEDGPQTSSRMINSLTEKWMVSGWFLNIIDTINLFALSQDPETRNETIEIFTKKYINYISMKELKLLLPLLKNVGKHDYFDDDVTRDRILTAWSQRDTDLDKKFSEALIKRKDPVPVDPNKNAPWNKNQKNKYDDSLIIRNLPLNIN